MLKLQYKDNPARGIWLVGDKVLLGADSSNTLVLNSAGVEPFHAEISIQHDALLLKSTAGACRVNNLLVDAEYQLQENDELLIGAERLVIVDPKQMDEDELMAGFHGAKEASESHTLIWSLKPRHPKLEGQLFHVSQQATLGRSKECEFPIPYKLLSREHARFNIENNQLFLSDLGSANGTFVNGKRIQQARLNNGDIIAFAKMEFIVEAPSKEIADEDSVNQTIIRSVADIEQELKKSKSAAANDPIVPPKKMLFDAEPREPITREVTAEHKKNINKTIMFLLMLIVGTTVAGLKWLGVW